MAYKLQYSKRFIKALKAASIQDRKRIISAVEKLIENPFPEGEERKAPPGL